MIELKGKTWQMNEQGEVAQLKADLMALSRGFQHVSGCIPEFVRACGGSDDWKYKKLWEISKCLGIISRYPKFSKTFLLQLRTCCHPCKVETQ